MFPSVACDILRAPATWFQVAETTDARTALHHLPAAVATLCGARLVRPFPSSGIVDGAAIHLALGDLLNAVSLFSAWWPSTCSRGFADCLSV